MGAVRLPNILVLTTDGFLSAQLKSLYKAMHVDMLANEGAATTQVPSAAHPAPREAGPALGGGPGTGLLIVQCPGQSGFVPAACSLACSGSDRDRERDCA